MKGGDVMQDAMDVARFLVQRFIDIKKPLTNMKLQKLLYFAWVDYYKATQGKYLYNDKICAWKLGPVIPEVYREYRKYAAMPITFTEQPRHELDKSLRSFLTSFVDENKDRTAISLVADTHRDGTPWKSVYVEGKMDIEIPFESIIRIECQ